MRKVVAELHGPHAVIARLVINIGVAKQDLPAEFLHDFADAGVGKYRVVRDGRYQQAGWEFLPHQGQAVFQGLR